MLKILLEQGLSNVLVVVTRYFGGILLGTGGLVRAYSDATIKALGVTEFVNKDLGYEAKLQIEYSQLENCKYYFSKHNIKIINTEYLDNIELIVEISEKESKKFTEDVNENNLKFIKYEILKEKYVEI